MFGCSCGCRKQMYVWCEVCRSRVLITTICGPYTEMFLICWIYLSWLYHLTSKVYLEKIHLNYGLLWNVSPIYWWGIIVFVNMLVVNKMSLKTFRQLVLFAYVSEWISRKHVHGIFNPNIKKEKKKKKEIIEIKEN